MRVFNSDVRAVRLRLKSSIKWSYKAKRTTRRGKDIESLKMTAA